MEISAVNSKPKVDLSFHPNEGSGKPTRVYLNVILQKIGTIDTANSLAELKIKFNMHWHDPQMIGYAGDPSKLPSELWGPRMDCPTGASDFTRIEERSMMLKNKETGHLLRTFIFEGNINNPMDLRAFPLDHDDIEAKFTCVSSLSAGGDIQRLQNENHVEWCSLMSAPVDIRASFPNEKFFNIAYWNRQLVEWDFHSFWYSFDKWKASSGILYAQLLIRFRVFRKTGYYFSKILFPLNLLFVFCMMIFAFEPDDFENRMNLGATMFLAVVAFLYVAGSDLPKVGYLTKMDYCIMFEMLAQMVSVLVSLGFKLVEFETETANLANRWGAVTCIGLYIIGIVGVLGWSMIAVQRQLSSVSMDEKMPEKTYLSTKLV